MKNYAGTEGVFYNTFPDCIELCVRNNWQYIWINTNRYGFSVKSTFIALTLAVGRDLRRSLCPNL